MLRLLPSSAWANGDLAEEAMECGAGQDAGTPKSKSTQPNLGLGADEFTHAFERDFNSIRIYLLNSGELTLYSLDNNVMQYNPAD